MTDNIWRNNMVKTDEERRLANIFNTKRLEYCGTIEKIVPELKREIKAKGAITMTQKDFAKKTTFKTKEGLHWDAKYCLFGNGIIITSVKNHEPSFLIRARTPEDILPPALKKYIERNIM